MLQEKRKLLIKTLPILLLGLFLFILYIFFFVGFDKIIEALREVNLNIFVLALLFTLLDTFFFTLTWHYLMQALSLTIKFRQAFTYVLIGIFVDILIPAESVSGELSKIYLIGKNGQQVGKVTASLVVQRILGMILTTISLVGGVLIYLLTEGTLPAIITYLTAIVVSFTVFFLALILIFCARPNWTRKLLDSIFNFLRKITRGRLRLDEWEARAKEGLEIFHDSIFLITKSGKKLIISGISSVLSWIFCLLTSQFIFFSLKWNISFPTILIVYSLTLAIKSVPIGIPTEVGVAEIVMTTFYSLFGVPIGICAVATILIRVLMVWLKFMMGFIALQWTGIKIIMETPK